MLAMRFVVFSILLTGSWAMMRQVEGTTLDRGHGILIERGIQLQGLVLDYNSFNYDTGAPFVGALISVFDATVGDYNSATNWNTSDGPVSWGFDVTSHVANGGTAQISADVPRVNKLFVGTLGSVGTVDHTGGDVRIDTGGSTEGDENWLFIGQDTDTGTYNQSGGTVTAHKVGLGQIGTGHGTYNLNGNAVLHASAALNDLNNTTPLIQVGQGDNSATGVMTISDSDGEDLLIWQRGAGMENGATRLQGDADSNGAVNDFDLDRWQMQFGQSAPGAVSELTSVPEPSTWVLMLLAILAGVCWCDVKSLGHRQRSPTGPFRQKGPTIVLAMLGMLLLGTEGVAVVHREDIILRDPFVYAQRSSGMYYLYGTVTYDGGLGFDVYSTTDPTLQTWSDPQPAFRRPSGFWGTSEFWAPEVFERNGSYYLFGTARSTSTPHGMFVLKSDSPTGPFTSHSSPSEPITEASYHSIDGTLFFDDLDDPWMVYTSERSTDPDHILHDMRAIRLLPDLTDTIPATDFKLFDATDFPHVTNFGYPPPGNSFLIVDGPEFYRSQNGSLLMAWSSFTDINGPGRSDYAVTIARSSNGKLDGTWVQESEPLYSSHGGHGMIFKDFEDQLRLSLHQPNSGGPSPSVPSFIPIYDGGDMITFVEPNQPASTVGYFRFEEGAATREFVDGVDLIDVSGKGNHLRTFSDHTAGTFRAQVSQPIIGQTGRRNLLSYDNSQDPGGTAPTRDLFVSSGPLNSADYSKWTIEASIQLSRQIPGHHHTIIGRDGSGYGVDGKLASLYFQVEEDNKLSITFVDQELDVNSVTSEFAINLHQWYNIAAVSDGVTLALYVDSSDGNGYLLAGQQLMTGPNNALIDNDRLWTIGRGMYDDIIADQFFGLIDEVRISDEALDPRNFLFANPIAGDFNDDGAVDGDDLGHWQSGFGMMGGATFADGDADGDGDVDGTDFLVWQRQLKMGSSLAQSLFLPVPESGSLKSLLSLLFVLPSACRAEVRQSRRLTGGHTRTRHRFTESKDTLGLHASDD